MHTKKLKWIECFESDRNQHFIAELHFGDQMTCAAYKISYRCGVWESALRIGLHKAKLITIGLETKEDAQQVCQEDYENWILSQLDAKAFGRPLRWELLPKQKTHFVANLYNGNNFIEFSYEVRKDGALWIASLINDSTIIKISEEHTEQLAKLVCQGHYTEWLRNCVKKTYVRKCEKGDSK